MKRAAQRALLSASRSSTRLSAGEAAPRSSSRIAGADLFPFPERRSAPRKQVAFVLLGGGARGAAQAGAVAAALEQGIRPDVFIGVSAGAWNGAYLAADPTPERARKLCAIWTELKTADLLGGWCQAAISVVSGQAALYRAAGPIRVARRYLDRQTFEALQPPLSLLATHLTNGQPQILSSGRLLPAMLASSTVPGIFPPLRSMDNCM